MDHFRTGEVLWITSGQGRYYGSLQDRGGTMDHFRTGEVLWITSGQGRRNGVDHFRTGEVQ